MPAVDHIDPPPKVFDRHVPTLDVAGFAQSSSEADHEFHHAIGPSRVEKSTCLGFGEFAFPRDALVRLVAALDPVLALAIARKSFDHFVHTTRYIATAGLRVTMSPMLNL